MTAPDTIAMLFDRTPATWSLRGDVQLWAELRERFRSTSLPPTRAGLTATLSASFVELTGASLQGSECIRVPRLDCGGMSGGLVDPSFWRDTAFPLIEERYVACTVRVSREQLRGALYGLLIGDALGVPYEFRAPEQLPPPDQLDMDPPAGFPRAHSGVPVGTWSDDGAQALCLLASLLHAGRMDVEDFGRRMVNWYEHGYMAVDCEVFDIGVQTREALEAIRAGTSAYSAASRDEQANGNGALMRVLPLALWHRGSDHDLVTDAHLSSLPTHGHPRSEVCRRTELTRCKMRK
ncbi:MAG: hypothetical protein RL385_1882 [Pseudomonadota bacterium]